MATTVLNPQLLADIGAHAIESGVRECCGLIVTYRRRKTYIRVRNIATRNEHFVMDAVEQAAAEDTGTVLAVVHSHPTTNPQPSQADLVGIERSQLPWVIINPLTGEYTETVPSGYEAPLVGREFQHGTLDCYALVRDYYKRNLGITLKDYARPDDWWLKDMDLFRDHFADTDFIQVKDGSLQLHDFLLIKVGSPVPNHGAVYMDDSANLILHHVMGKVSSTDRYDGFWRKQTILTLRHRKLFRDEVAA